MITSAELEKISANFMAKQPKLTEEKELSLEKTEEKTVEKKDLHSLMAEAIREVRECDEQNMESSPAMER